MDKKPQRIKLAKVKGFCTEEVKNWSIQNLEPGTRVVSDGLALLIFTFYEPKQAVDF
ncbi:MAG: hypothetical protein WA081_08725 [Desulfosalsimonadaceae bacterium]